MLKIIFLPSLVVFLVSCTTPTKRTTRQDGLVQHHINCYADGVWSGGGCDQEALEICPGGYTKVSDYGGRNNWGAKTRNLVIVCGDLVDQTNPFKRFFQPRPVGPVPEGYAVPFSGQPSLQVVQESQLGVAFRDYLRNNSDFIGQSCFDVTGTVDATLARSLPPGVKDVSAVLVSSGVLESKVETKIVSKPTMTMNTATVTGFGAWPAYGSGFSFGEENIPVQETVTRIRYCSFYFVNISRKPVFGVIPRDLTDSEKKNLNSHKGTVIDVLIKNSPAYQADLFEGDVIMSLNGIPVSAENLLELVNRFSGKSVEVKYLRNLKPFKKRIKFIPI